MKKRFIFALLAVSLLPVAAADVKDGSQALSKDYIEPSGRFGLLKTEGDTLHLRTHDPRSAGRRRHGLHRAELPA